MNLSVNNFPVVNVDQYHPLLEINYNVVFNNVYNLHYNEIVYNWNRAKYHTINLEISQINWFNLFKHNIIDTSIFKFYSIIIFTVQNYFITLWHAFSLAALMLRNMI
jgi:hypothetical protein